MEIDANWDHYRSFLAVLQTGSLSAAARRLGLTQPTLGRHIETLEVMAGNHLFIRSAQGLIPTETALAMRPMAEAMEAASRSLLRMATGSAQTVGGTVRISASEIIAIEVLPPILTGLQDAYPELQLELSLSDAVEDLLHHQADIAVRMVAPSQNALVSRSVGPFALGFFAHHAYLNRHGKPETLADLAKHRLIGFDRQFAYIRDILQIRPDLADLRFSFRTDSNAAQLAAIRAGLGIGICQCGVAYPDDQMEEVLPGKLDLTLAAHVVMHENLKASQRCRVTFDALVKGLDAYKALQRKAFLSGNA
ncbi:LysR family transcriptional regulator [Allorhizobium sp. BGMRC 0089]|uniref:LysR family transcriptional regulator n=1 Tax=Allorhizobium sonneratiae TaxID=2934936 RepID=UPI0020336727|nr:LysR family transcriptional regulator [Allorhizobium sonneratiae]MCM2291251.1 LysR family transcriptional regulator [Allorhizobium sonneratiae]